MLRMQGQVNAACMAGQTPLLRMQGRAGWPLEAAHQQDGLRCCWGAALARLLCAGPAGLAGLATDCQRRWGGPVYQGFPGGMGFLRMQGCAHALTALALCKNLREKCGEPACTVGACRALHSSAVPCSQCPEVLLSRHCICVSSLWSGTSVATETWLACLRCRGLPGGPVPGRQSAAADGGPQRGLAQRAGPRGGCRRPCGLAGEQLASGAGRAAGHQVRCKPLQLQPFIYAPQVCRVATQTLGSDASPCSVHAALSGTTVLEACLLTLHVCLHVIGCISAWPGPMLSQRLCTCPHAMQSCVPMTPWALVEAINRKQQVSLNRCLLQVHRGCRCEGSGRHCPARGGCAPAGPA